jgi:hypothetical protein
MKALNFDVNYISDVYYVIGERTFRIITLSGQSTTGELFNADLTHFACI